MRAVMRTAFAMGLTLGLLTGPATAGADAAAADTAPEQLGHVSFANSCAVAVQPGLQRAVALLHSFWWGEGAKAFRDVLAHDQGCAVATWGIAALAIGNPFGQGPGPNQAQSAQQALARGREIGAKTERERAFVEAIGAYYEKYPEQPHRERLKALAHAFEEVAGRFSDDDEAQIFYALYLTATQEPGDKTFATTLKAADILQVQFAKHPDHPGVAHYLIHAYDYPPIADKGLAAALCYADIAPSAPHALHMPSHIFTRIGAWRESVATNERSVAAAKAQGDPYDSLHAMDYMVYAELQLARDNDARALVEAAPGITATNPAILAAPYSLAAIPARYAVERNAWQEAAHLQPSVSRYPYTTAITYFARALGAARSGDPAAAEKDVQELAKIADALRSTNNEYWATEVRVQRLAAAAWTTFAKGHHDEALLVMRAAADTEDRSEKAGVSPGRLVPARELLGDMLLETGRYKEALAEYETSQARDPKRFRNLFGAGFAAAQGGHRDKAQYYFQHLVDMAGSGNARPEIAKARAYLAGSL
jgi:tetratricopeptide (TPR) repeat protein